MYAITISGGRAMNSKESREENTGKFGERKRKVETL